MNNGISVYSGLNCTLEDNLNLIETASSLGLKRIFTSTQIPEAESDFDDFAAILAAALENEFEIILDVNADNFDTFDFEQITLRLDDGFDLTQIAELSNIRRIMLNASTINEEFLTTLNKINANFDNISALHNFYPHPYTGLDDYYFFNQNKIFHSFGISVGAFAASKDGLRRPPIGEGLPTLESTRNYPVDLAARYLAALDADFIIMSDSMPTNEECASLSQVKSNEVIINIKLQTGDAATIELIKNTFSSRPEVCSQVIRAANSRNLLIDSIEPDNNPCARQFGDITVDNINFGRYMGEIQIVKTDLPSDSRVNVIAKVVDSDLPLIDFIRPDQNFSFKFIS